MTVDAHLRVDGVWLAASGLPYGDLSWTDRADGGNYEASWSMQLAYGERPAPLRKGATVEVYLGPVRRWYGQMSEFGWDDGSFTAVGISQRAYDFAARTASGLPTSIADVAVNTSISYDGWAVTNAGVSGLATDAEPPQSFSTVGAVCDLAASRAGRHWGVWGDGVIRSYTEPTVYDYLVAPGVIELGETTEEEFSAVVYSYINPGGAQVGGYVGTSLVGHTLQDFTNLGPISDSTAAQIAQNLLNLGTSARGWTSGAEVSSAQLLTPGGLPAELANVTAGQMIRATIAGELGQPYRDLVIGEIKHPAGSDVLSLSPIGKVATSLSDVIEDAYTRITGQPVGA